MRETTLEVESGLLGTGPYRKVGQVMQSPKDTALHAVEVPLKQQASTREGQMKCSVVSITGTKA